VLLTLGLGAAMAALVVLTGTAREAHAAFPDNNGKPQKPHQERCTRRRTQLAAARELSAAEKADSP
jgi:hypothetical protein